MSYAQTNYRQFVGNSHLGIDEIGCFICADSNLLEKVGIEEAPDALNVFYQQHNLFQYDLTDRANDDITWSTVTKFCPQLVVKQIGSGGWPDSDLAQVEFRYRSHTGAEVTHFCAVNHAADRSIIDSYDGQVKTPAQYEAVYGQPIAWATFEHHVPTPEPAPAPAAPVSAPVAQPKPSEPASAPAPASPEKLYLPPSVWIWHVYKPEGPYTLPYAIGALDPKLYGGLTYDILGNPAPHVYLIHTENFGQVAIYAGPDTVAQFPGTGHGEGENTGNPGENQNSGLPVAEVVPAPAPAPAEPSIVYSRFPESMQLVTKPGAQRINFVSGTVVDNLPEGTPFEAVGKATLPNNDAYYMNDNDFGIADETQRTPITVGIKTVDLSPAPAPAPAVANPENPAEPETAPSEAAPAAAPLDVPELPWQRSMKFFMNPVPYVVKGKKGDVIKIVDFESGNELDVKAGTPVTVAGRFIFGGLKYYRAKSSVDNKTWYGFPVASLAKQDSTNTPFDTGDDINQLEDQIIQDVSRLSAPKHAAIKAGATAQGLLSRLRKK